jgi:hypothetical protein
MAGSPLSRGADIFHVRAPGAPWYGGRREWERYWDGRGREAWEALGPTRRINRGLVPSQFFWFDPDVPEALRGKGTVEELQDWELAARRWRWWIDSGRVPPGEVDAAEQWHEEFCRRAARAREHGTDPRRWPGALR